METCIVCSKTIVGPGYFLLRFFPENLDYGLRSWFYCCLPHLTIGINKLVHLTEPGEFLLRLPTGNYFPGLSSVSIVKEVIDDLRKTRR